MVPDAIKKLDVLGFECITRAKLVRFAHQFVRAQAEKPAVGLLSGSISSRIEWAADRLALVPAQAAGCMLVFAHLLAYPASGRRRFDLFMHVTQVVSSLRFVYLLRFESSFHFLPFLFYVSSTSSSLTQEITFARQYAIGEPVR